MVAEELRRRGIDAEKALSEVGLDMGTIDREGVWISFLQHAALLDIAARESGDDLFGLRVALQLDPRDLGPIGYVGLSARTLGDALLNLERYLATMSEAWTIELSVHDDLVQVALKPTHLSFFRYRQASEFRSCAFVRACQFVTKTEITPQEVKFAHRCDGDPREHQRVLGCPVTFGHSPNQVILSYTDLATPIATADDRLLRILTSSCEEVLRKREGGKPEHIAKIERCIIDLLPTQHAKARNVATELGMSERTLVRHLAESGTSFSEILNQLRHELALKYLCEPGLNLSQVALLLGYSNQSAFSAAFKRMTGRSPKEMRGKHWSSASGSQPTSVGERPVDASGDPSQPAYGAGE